MSTNDFPSNAGTVVIGSGIVGSSLVGELAERGRDDILLIDKGPLSDPGGSTGHASNFIFPVEHSKDMTKLTSDSRDIYREFDVFENSGGIEVARTEERMEELKRRVVSAKSFGEEAELLTPEEVEELVPYVNTEIIEGGFYSKGAGTCDPLRAGELYRQQAKDAGALRTAPNTEVTDLHVEDGEITAVETDKGTVEADEVVIAAGLWSPKIAEMAGVDIPLSPAVHQLISVGPIDQFDGEGEINYPVVRDMDAQMYERQHGNDLEVGSYEHRPILWDVEDVPSIEESPLSPTQPPLTEDAFEESMQHALEIVPEVLDDPGAGIRHDIDGLLSVTPDGHPLLGPIPEVDGLWSCAAIWIKEAPAIAREVSKWMTKGHPDIDIVAHDHVARFDEYGETKEFVKSRGDEGYRKIYGIVHPREQWQSTRPLRTSGFYHRQQELGAEFFEAGGWERPRWFESNEDLVEEYAEEIEGLRRPNEWDSRWWSEITLAEHLHLRDNVGMIGDTGFGIFDIVGGDAAENMERICVAEMQSLDPGESVYTPVLAPNAGFVSDLTVARLGKNHYRVITGGAHAGQDKTWFSQHLEGDSELIGRSSELCTLGVWGPNAEDLMDEITEEEMSAESFDFAEMKDVTVGPVDVKAFRISYVGEFGWELYCPMEKGQRLWDTIYEAGQEYDLRPVGTGVYGETGRMEKGYRLMGAELEIDYNPSEAGLTIHGVKDEEFIGKDAYADALDEENTATLCTLSVTDHAPDGGEPRFMTGGEPILDADGNVLIDDEGRRSYVTSAGTGPSVGKHLLMAYLPQEYAAEGEELQVEYFGQQYPVEVEVAGYGGVFDPDNERLFRNEY